MWIIIHTLVRCCNRKGHWVLLHYFWANCDLTELISRAVSTVIEYLLVLITPGSPGLKPSRINLRVSQDTTIRGFALWYILLGLQSLLFGGQPSYLTLSTLQCVSTENLPRFSVWVFSCEYHQPLDILGFLWASGYMAYIMLAGNVMRTVLSKSRYGLHI